MEVCTRSHPPRAAGGHGARLFMRARTRPSVCDRRLRLKRPSGPRAAAASGACGPPAAFWPALSGGFHSTNVLGPCGEPSSSTTTTSGTPGAPARGQGRARVACKVPRRGRRATARPRLVEAAVPGISRHACRALRGPQRAHSSCRLCATGAEQVALGARNPRRDTLSGRWQRRGCAHRQRRVFPRWPGAVAHPAGPARAAAGWRWSRW